MRSRAETVSARSRSTVLAALLMTLACGDAPTATPAHEGPQAAQVVAFGDFSIPLAKIADVAALHDMDLPPRPRAWDTDPDALVDVLERVGGRATIAFKAPTNGRTISDFGRQGRKEAVASSFIKQGLELLAEQGVEIRRYSANIGSAHVTIRPELAPALARHPLIDWIEPSVPATESLLGTARRSDPSRSATPFFAETRPWGVDTVRAPSVWSRADGSGVKVMLIDSGHEGHNDLPSLDSINCNWGMGNGACVDDAYTSSGTHGTGVLGTLAAIDNTIGIIGVAPGLDADDIYMWQICDSINCDNWPGQLDEAFDSAVAWGVQVVNMSVGDTSSYDVNDAGGVSYAKGTGDIVLIASMGNRGISEAVYPAAYSGVVAVSGIDSDKSFADPSSATCSTDSSWGSIVDISAPFDAYSTEADNLYMTYCGNSFAAPHVTGVAAMIREYIPSLSQYNTRLRLFDTVRDLGSAGWDNLFGHGLVDAYNALGPWTDIEGDFTVQPDQEQCEWEEGVDGGYGTVSYTWYVDDVQEGTGRTFNYEIGSSGSFQLKLTATDGQSVSHSKTRTVSISEYGAECLV